MGLKLTKILSRILQEGRKKQLSDLDYIDFAESELFLELANPDMALPYDEEEPNIWTFSDLYGNKLGVFITPQGSVKSFFSVKDKSGKPQRSFDLQRDEEALDKNSYKIGEDERRSNTIAKIILYEIIPRHLSKKPSMIQFQMINEYRYKIFEKIADLAKEKYPDLDIQKLPRTNLIRIVNK